ncbi:F-box/kelch-repeat protein At3g06240-like [Mercurialis annua]|uniref:F-box/kelch-repeat protein At3g06240-like n=1 Tax=Mercurialis annua TaxID=3986 RepID=UPI00215E2DE5|nr:F-box/kelch-repeat protein At3g06240-like [Mercurialis annua]
MSDHIPQEVLTEIFLRLPVRSILRCRCVCKLWYSLISNPNFIFLHSKQITYSKNNNTGYLLMRHYSRTNKKESFTLHLDDDDLFSHEYQNLDFPLRSSWDYFEIVGSCNGILCLTDNHSHMLKRIVLWNPSIGLSVTLPLQRIRYRVLNVVLGFGYDSRTNDYKVVLEGAIHWVGYYSPEKLTIAVFLVHDEEFKEFKVPDEISGTSVQHLSVMLCGELLSIIQYKKRRNHLGYESCCIWIMNEYGADDSWTKLFNVFIGGVEGLGKVLGLRNNFEVLVVRENGELISYDPWNLSIKCLGIYGESCSFYAAKYMESLVLLKK